MKFTRAEIFEFMELEGAEMFQEGHWRHGHSERWVVPFGGSFFAFWINIDPNEGLVDESVEAVEMKQIEVKSFKWVEI